MYKNAFFLFLIIFIFCGCQKKDLSITEEERTDIDLTMNDEENSQKYAVSPGTALLINDKNFPLEDIMGTWWAGAPNHTLEIEFTNDNRFYIREFDFHDNFAGEDLFPYKIEGNNIIVENIDKTNNIDKYIISNIFPSDIIHISELNEKSLYYDKSSYRFYRGTVKEVLERRGRYNIYVGRG